MAGVKGRSGRITTNPKNKVLFGYRYTQEEYDKLIKIMEIFQNKGFSKAEIVKLAIYSLEKNKKF